MLDARQLEPALTEKEILLRDAFVSEYLKDFDPFRACLRLGFQATYATQWSHTLFQDGYVQRKLAALEQTANDDAIRAKLEQRLLQLALKGSDSASVSAIKELNAMKGWSKSEDGGGSEELSAQFRRLAEQLPT